MTSWNGYLVHIFLAQEPYHSFTSVKFYIFSILNIFKMDVKDDDREADWKLVTEYQPYIIPKENNDDIQLNISTHNDK